MSSLAQPREPGDCAVERLLDGIHAETFAFRERRTIADFGPPPLALASTATRKCRRPNARRKTRARYSFKSQADFHFTARKPRLSQSLTATAAARAERKAAAGKLNGFQAAGMGDEPLAYGFAGAACPESHSAISIAAL